MREKFWRFMQGRYGNDGLSRFLDIVIIVLLVLQFITKSTYLYYLGLALCLWVLYRTFSRNIAARQAENEKFYQLKDYFRHFGQNFSRTLENHRIYRYYRCPQCRQKLRVPRGRGRIQITCPRCGTQFIKKV